MLFVSTFPYLEKLGPWEEEQMPLNKKIEPIRKILRGWVIVEKKSLGIVKYNPLTLWIADKKNNSAGCQFLRWVKLEPIVLFCR